ncbi:MAG: hypothetical protein ACUVQP_10885, partial [Bacteroidales bacterium]
MIKMIDKMIKMIDKESSSSSNSICDRIVPLSGLTLILLILSLYPLLCSGYVTNDDMNFALMPFDFTLFKEIAIKQGRVGFILWLPITLIPHIFNNFIIFKVVQIGTILFSVFISSYLLRSLTKIPIIGYLFFLLFISLWQNTWEHNPLSAYPFIFSAQIILFTTSCLLLLKSINEKKKNLLPLSAIIYFIVLFGMELWVLYIVLISGIAFINCTDRERSPLHLIKILRWHLLAIIVYLCTYFVWRAYHPSTYGGNIVNFSSTLSAFFKTLIVYSTGLFPGIQFVIHQQQLFWDISAIIKAVCILVLFTMLRSKIAAINISIKSVGLIIITSIFLIITPNLLVAITSKYQDWVAHGSSSYVYSHYSYFGIILLFVLLVICSAKKTPAYYAVLIVIIMMSYMSDINNRMVGRDQCYSRIKWVLFDTFLSSEEFMTMPENTRIYAPTLWNARGIAASHDSYWSQYVLTKTGKKVFVEKSDKNATVELQYVDANNADFQYLSVYEHGSLKSIYTWGNQCMTRPCTLLIDPKDAQIANWLDQNTFITKNGMIAIPLRGATNTRGIQKFVFSPPAVSKEVLLLPYSPNSLEKSISINFTGGFYGVERNTKDSWRWCSGEGTINLYSYTKQMIMLQMDVVPAAKGHGWLIMPDGKKLDLSAEKPTVKSIVSLNEGDNKLSIIFDHPPVQLNPKDPRRFSFLVRRLSIIPYGGYIDPVSKIAIDPLGPRYNATLAEGIDFRIDGYPNFLADV